MKARARLILSRVILAVILIALAVFVVRCGSPHRPELKIVKQWDFMNFEGHREFILDWCVDGKSMQQASFYSEAERARFVEYLGRVGKVVE